MVTLVYSLEPSRRARRTSHLCIVQLRVHTPYRKCVGAHWHDKGVDWRTL